MADGGRIGSAGIRIPLGGLLLLVVWLSAEVRRDIGPSAPRAATRSNVEASIARGDYNGAEKAARELIARFERDLPASWPELARARNLLVETLVAGGRAADPSTLELARANVDIHSGLDSVDQLDLAKSHHNLGDVYFQRGEYAKSLAEHEAGLKIRASLVAPGHAIADSLERLATTQMRMERYDEAGKNLEQALAIRSRRSAEDPLSMARVLELIAWLHRYAGTYAEATEPLAEALRTLRQFSPDHPALVTAIELQGDLSMLQGDIASAVAFWKDALSLTERTLGVEHPLVSALERRLAYGANALADRVEGKRRLDRALSIAELTRADCDPELMAAIDLSGEWLIFDGDYVAARKRFLSALDLSQKCFGSDSSITATILFNLASLATQMGDLSEASRLYNSVILTWSARGAHDSYVAKALDALGNVLETNGDLPGARELFDRALTIRRQIRRDHPDVAWTLINLARVVAASGDLSTGLRYLTEATDIYRQNGTSIEPDHLARALMLQGEIHSQGGTHALARADFAEALSLRERNFGAEHPLTSEARLKMAAADLALGRYPEALAGASTARESGLDHVKFTVRYLPERRALAYASRIVSGLDLELSIANSVPSVAPSRFLDAVIRSRGIVLDELVARAHVLSDPRPEAAAMQTRLNTARQRFANLMLRSMTAEAASPDLAAMLNAARQEREDAEQAFAEQGATFRSQLATAEVGLADVREKLPADSALVSFVRYERTIMRSGGSHSQLPRQLSAQLASTVPSYMAFLLRSREREPAMIPLGDAASIDELVTRWRRQMLAEVSGTSKAQREGSLNALGAQLRRRIWDPIVGATHGVNRAFVVPDGALNLVPFGALPGDKGTYLVEQLPIIHYVSAERDLVRSYEPSGASAGLLAIGGPAFADVSALSSGTSTPLQQREQPALAGATQIEEERVRTTIPGCDTFRSITFDALPAAKVEAEIVGGLWDRIGTTQGQRARVLTGRAATERAFKDLGPRRRILHLATHGFFLGEDCSPAVTGTRAVGGLTPTLVAQPATPWRATAIENPLLLSGLALAGANQRAAAHVDDDDGILTAEEVAALNLEGVEWAVLSACNTGLGTLAAGEGVLGLRRAFQVAGVRTVIMSLWSVEDGAAKEWMEALYRARLVDRLDTANSVQQASLAILRDRRATGRSTQPFYWASFVAAGDWH